MGKNKKYSSKKVGNTVEILGVKINSTSIDSVLKEITKRILEGKKSFVVTPNPEFLVFAWENPWFKEILNSADFAIPDGIGLVWASKLLGRPLKQRVAGADLVEEFLKKASVNGWRVGVVGARRGEKKEREIQMSRLREKYPRAEILALEDTPGWEKKKWNIIFACQGMGKQEKWLADNFTKINAGLLMGIGGALDFLTDFAHRAPLFIRLIGFEWLWRLLIQPWRFRRQLKLGKFIWLCFKENKIG